MISDLLKPEKSNLVIHEDAKRGVYVHGLSEWVVRSPEEVCSHTSAILVQHPLCSGPLLPTLDPDGVVAIPSCCGHAHVSWL